VAAAPEASVVGDRFERSVSIGQAVSTASRCSWRTSSASAVGTLAATARR
jgi:hypothetical protein